MDLKHPTTKTPPHSHPTNGKTHHHHHLRPPHTAVTYKECLKNHAVGIGGHALDGCGEFMHSSTYTPTDPSSFKCAACGCHRNFHRRQPANDYPTSPSPPSPPSPPPEHTNYAYGQHLLLSLSTVADQPVQTVQTQTVATPGTPVAIKISGRKRFRTKFSQDQKEKMLAFAEKVGWKMQRCEEHVVAEFCNEIGIRRRIFKVWMHNNKNTLAKREKDNPGGGTITVTHNSGGSAAVGRSTDSNHQENGSCSSS